MGEREIKTFLFNRRKELGLSQEYVAGLLDISVTSYRKIENGKTSLYNKKGPKTGRNTGHIPFRTAVRLHSPGRKTECPEGRIRERG